MTGVSGAGISSVTYHALRDMKRRFGKRPVTRLSSHAIDVACPRPGRASRPQHGNARRAARLRASLRLKLMEPPKFLRLHNERDRFTGLRYEVSASRDLNGLTFDDGRDE